jgi:DUF4097 and DUF4098 domain-containing protein YvlB
MLLTLLALTTATTTLSDTTLRLPRGTEITIESMAQSIRLTGTTGDRVTITNGEASLDDGHLWVEGNGSGVLEVSVPAWAVTTVEATLGSVEVRDAPAELAIEAMTGNVTVTGGRGRLEIFATSGSVTITAYRGERIDVEAVTGTLEIRDAAGDLDLETVSSAIRLTRVRSASVAASTTAGAIEWEGAIPADARYRFESHSGSIGLTVPATLDARLRFSTVTGSFGTTVPAQTTGERGRGDPNAAEGGRELVATYGRGSASIEIDTFEGSVRVSPLGGA